MLVVTLKHRRTGEIRELSSTASCKLSPNDVWMIICWEFFGGKERETSYAFIDYDWRLVSAQLEDNS